MSKRDLISDLLCIHEKFLAEIKQAGEDLKRDIRKIHEDKDEPEIPEGFERWNGGDCPVPEYCVVDAVYGDGTRTFGKYASANRWSHYECGDGDCVIAYRVTSVPTLTIDDDVKDIWVVGTNGNIQKYPAHTVFGCSTILAGMAYRTEEHAETALKWGLLHDVYYTKMGFERLGIAVPEVSDE